MKLRTDGRCRFSHWATTYANVGAAKGGIRKGDNKYLLSINFEKSLLPRPDSLRIHLSGIFGKRVDVSRQYEPDRTLFPGNAVLAHRPETYYAPVPPKLWVKRAEMLQNGVRAAKYPKASVILSPDYSDQLETNLCGDSLLGLFFQHK